MMQENLFRGVGATALCLAIAVAAHGAESERGTLVEAKSLSYNVSNRVGLLVGKPQSIDSVRQAFDPTLGVEIDEVSMPHEGVTIQFLSNSGAPIHFRRQVERLSNPKADRSPMSREAINADVVDMFGELGMGDFTSGENKISANDWSECPAKIVSSESSEQVPRCFCLSRTLSYKGIPSLASVLSITVSAETGELVTLTYLPTIGVDDIEAKVAVADAEQTALAILEKQEWEKLSHETSRLIITSPNDTFAEKNEPPFLNIDDQRLTWEVTYTASKRDREHKFKVFVDAMTGAVIGGMDKYGMDKRVQEK